MNEKVRDEHLVCLFVQDYDSSLLVSQNLALHQFNVVLIEFASLE
jgi:hypothetical protein